MASVIKKVLFEIKKIDYHDFLPKDLANELDALDIIPILENDNIQFLMPYKIKVK